MDLTNLINLSGYSVTLGDMRNSITCFYVGCDTLEKAEKLAKIDLKSLKQSGEFNCPFVIQVDRIENRKNTNVYDFMFNQNPEWKLLCF